LTKSNRRQLSAGTSGAPRPVAEAAANAEVPVTAERPGSRPVPASRSRRAGRRETTRRSRASGSFLERHRTRLLYGVIVAAVALVGGWMFVQGSQPVYACSDLFAADEPAPSGRLGVIQPDLGNRHEGRVGAKVTYTLCPPASGMHYNQPPHGPIPAGFYGPNDRAIPQGWVHNLEHGGLVVLYSCSQGACDPDDVEALRTMFRGWDMESAVCKIPARTQYGVVARFDEMPKPYAALLWGRVLYMDTLDPALVREFYVSESEILSEDEQEFIVPPERQCNPPSPSPSPSASPSGSASPSPSASGSASPSVSPSGSPSASPSASASPSPSAS
jgi:hypothetical protein